MDYGATGASRFARTRGRINGSFSRGINYPSPFFDIGHTYLPTTVKQMFQWCRYYFLVHPLINSTVFKLALYPITDIVYHSDDRHQRDLWRGVIEDHFRYRVFMGEIGLDYNCLAGNTRVVLRDRVVPIKDLAGKQVDVLSEGGVYRPASFKSYGKQELWEVHTADGVLFATADHEWPVLDRNTHEVVRRKTRDLAGRSLVRTPAKRPAQDKEFWAGVRHGIVFGDGTLSNEGRQAHVLFHSEKKRELAKYFEDYTTVTPHHADKYLGVYGLPPAYKKLPEHDSSPEHWYGFVCGLLATDGCVDNRGGTVLTQKDRRVLLEIAEHLPLVGIVCGKVREHWAWSSFTKEREPMNYLTLKAQYLLPQDFVRSDQRARYESHFTPTKYGKYMRVKKTVPTGRMEEVYCCVEPETHSFVIENSVLTGNCYGNGLVSLFYPFLKKLQCPKCNNTQPAKGSEYYIRNFQFYWQCPRCSHHGPAKVFDEYIKSSKGIRLLRWNPEDVNIRYNDLTGDYTYYYDIPVQLKNDIIMGKKSVVEEVPQIFIEALKTRKSIVFNRENIYHFKRPTLAGKDRGWGVPLLLPVLKDAFYLQILKKSQEAIALEHIVPLRILFPQAGSATTDPYSTINLSEWKDQIADELKRWRLDNNYIPILPLPVGNQTIGGDGRALLLGQEIRMWSEQIVTGMGVPQELVFGGLSYSGSNVSLRMLENMFLGYMTDHLHLINWVVKNVASYMDWEPIKIKFKPFKMADDLQRKAYNFQLNQSGKISDTTLLADADFDPEREDDLTKNETDRRAEAQKKARLAQADIEGESQMIMMRWQLKAQQEQMQMQQAGQPTPGEPGAEAEGVGPGGQAMPGAEGQQPGGGAAPLPQQQMAAQAPPPIPAQSRAELPPAMTPAQSPLVMGQQQQQGGAGAEGGGINVDLLAQAQQVAQYLLQVDENSRIMALMNLRQQSPEFYQTVLGLMQNMMGGGSSGAAGEPLPEQRPPQRGPEAAQV